MLFKFGKEWKTLLFLLSTWALYGLFGFEFVAITVLSLIYASKFKNSNSLF
jgi:hypothetical protein